MSAGTTHQLDVAALHGALDAVRMFKRTTWSAIAEETGVDPGSLTRLGKGLGVDADALVTLLAWLGHHDGPLGKYIVARTAP